MKNNLEVIFLKLQDGTVFLDQCAVIQEDLVVLALEVYSTKVGDKNEIKHVSLNPEKDKITIKLLKHGFLKSKYEFRLISSKIRT